MSKQPNVNVQLAEPVSLFQSDEFETETSFWRTIKEPDNYRYENGELALLFTNEDGIFKGHARQLDFRVLKPRGVDLPLYGFYEARIKVDSIRKGRSCQFYLVPKELNLNPDDSIDDKTARKGAREG